MPICAQRTTQLLIDIDIVGILEVHIVHVNLAKDDIKISQSWVIRVALASDFIIHYHPLIVFLRGSIGWGSTCWGGSMCVLSS